jgi:hypothetical protein
LAVKIAENYKNAFNDWLDKDQTKRNSREKAELELEFLKRYCFITNIDGEWMAFCLNCEAEKAYITNVEEKKEYKLKKIRN